MRTAQQVGKKTKDGTTELKPNDSKTMKNTTPIPADAGVALSIPYSRRHKLQPNSRGLWYILAAMTNWDKLPSHYTEPSMEIDEVSRS